MTMERVAGGPPKSASRGCHPDFEKALTRLELSTALFESLELFHNRQRRHSSLGMLTPVEFESRRGAEGTSTVA